MTNPLIFMVSVAGKPNQKRITQYLCSLKNAGIQQVMIYPRSGCELQYMSDEWFEMIGFFLRCAKQLGMKIWLYDDFNWPSGDAAGEVTANPSHRLKFIKISGEDSGKIISSTDEGDTLYFGENAFTNLMSVEAVDCFINHTHEKYYERFSEHFGDTIVGIFTDEPAVGYGCGNDALPYYDELPMDYLTACGRDFYSDIENENPELTVVAMKVIAERFKSVYINRLVQWCKSHKIIMTGHLMNDNTPFNSVRASGDLLKCLSGFMLPGVDEIHTNLKSGWLYTLLGAAQYAAGNEGAMAELFALGPCELSYTTKLCMIFLAACFKVNHYFLAISHIDFRGNMRITDFFNHFGVDQPDFDGMKTFARLAEIAAKYAEKDYKADVYIRYPTYVCAKNHLSGIDDYPLSVITNKLSYHQIQWKFIAADDESSDAPIIEFDDAFNYILGDMVTADADAICEMLPESPIVYDENGNLPEGIFVRKYSDGEYVIVNVKGDAGTYFVNGERFDLEVNGVLISSFANQDRPLSQKHTLDVSFNVSYLSSNVTRAICSENDEARIYCDSPKEIVFAVRNGEGIVVNGKQAVAAKNTVLTFGFQELYSDSPAVFLDKGVNTIKSKNDFCFMPTAFIIGDFIAAYDTENKTVKLFDRKNKLSVGERFEGYGIIKLEAAVDVPTDANAIKIEGTQLFTQVYINGVFADEKITAPYVFDVSKYKGTTINLSIVQYSSMAPMFGDSDSFVRHGSLVSKKIKDRSVLFGIDDIYFV